MVGHFCIFKNFPKQAIAQWAVTLLILMSHIVTMKVKMDTTSQATNLEFWNQVDLSLTSFYPGRKIHTQILK
jgi:hypothetical protein